MNDSVTKTNHFVDVLLKHFFTSRSIHHFVASTLILEGEPRNTNEVK